MCMVHVTLISRKRHMAPNVLIMNFAALKALNDNQSLNQSITFYFCYLHISINSFFILLRWYAIPIHPTKINPITTILQWPIFVLQKRDKLIIPFVDQNKQKAYWWKCFNKKTENVYLTSQWNNFSIFSSCANLAEIIYAV